MTTFGNIKKHGFVYSIYHNKHYLNVIIYKIANKEINVVKDISGKKTSNIKLSLQHWVVNDKTTESDLNYIRNLNLIDLEVKASDCCFTDDNRVYYADKDLFVNSLNNYKNGAKGEIETCDKLLNFYASNFFTDEKSYLDRFDSMYIGSLNQNNPLGLNQIDACPTLVTWKQLKKLYQEGKLNYQIERMLDWNRCFRTNFVKFQYDPYTGKKIDWGRINNALTELLGTDYHI